MLDELVLVVLLACVGHSDGGPMSAQQRFTDWAHAAGASETAYAASGPAVGDWTFFRAGSLSGYANGTSVVGSDGSGDWAAFFAAAPPTTVASAWAQWTSGGAGEVVDPTSPRVTALAAAQRGVVTAPALGAADGATTLTFWTVAPPSFTPVRHVLTARPGQRLTDSQAGLDTLVTAVDPVAAALATVAAGGPSKVDGLKQLAASEDPRAVDALLAALADTWAEARAAAAAGLARPGHGELAGPLGAAAAKETDEAARIAEIDALGKIGGPEAKSALLAVATGGGSDTTRGRAKWWADKLP